MLVMVMGLALLIAIHLVPAQPEIRGTLVARMGDGGYKVLFSVLSLAGLALIVVGWQKLGLSVSKNPEIWTPPVWTRHVSLLLMLPAMILLAAAYIPSRIRTAAKHPMLAAVKIWAFSHLLANGDLASIVLFGSLLAYAVFARISMKRRAAGSGLGPLGTRTGGIGGDIAAVAIGTALYAALLLGVHRWLFGVAPLPSLSA